ncbi:MAG: acetylxylan esterase [Massilia sp.]
MAIIAAGPWAAGAALCWGLGAMLAAPTCAAQQAAPESSRASLVRYLDAQAGASLAARRGQLAAIATPAQAQARQSMVRARLLALVGTPAHGVPLAAKVTGGSRGDDYRVENVLYDAQRGRHVTANLFLPATGQGPFPAVIMAPGHGLNGKLGNYSFAANFARNGFVVLSYDIVGEGERLEHIDAPSGKSLGERPTGEHSLAAYPAMLNGEHVARYFIEDAMQGVDYLATRPEVDARRIGAFGCSGGGTITAYLAALDPRVQATANACYVNDFAHLLAGIGPQDAEQSIPDFIADGFDIADWIELAAPKPYAVISTTGDMFPYAGAQAAVEEIGHFWSAFGAAERVEWLVGPGGHGAIAPMGDRIVDFFRRALTAAAPALPFANLKPARDEDVRVTPSGQLATSVGSVTLADLARARAQAIAPSRALATAPLRAAITRLARVRAQPGAAVKTDAPTESTLDGLTTVATALQSEIGPLTLTAHVAAGAPPRRVLLLLDPAPLDTQAAPGGRLRQLAADGWAVVNLQARGADGGGEVKHSLVGDQDLLALRAMLVGRTLPGIRIDDTMAAVDWIARRFPSLPITLDGVGTMGPIALQAALLDARVSAVRTDAAPVSWRAAVSQPRARQLPANAIPGVLAVYDLPDVIAALAPRRVDIVAPQDPQGASLSEQDFHKLVPTQAHVHYHSAATP